MSPARWWGLRDAIPGGCQSPGSLFVFAWLSQALKSASVEEKGPLLRGRGAIRTIQVVTQ
jgi:hypothetical protein